MRGGLSAGALGGKLLGAGGGFMLFYVAPERRAELRMRLKKLLCVPFSFSDTDAQAAQAAGCNPFLFGSVLCGCSDSLKWVTGLPAARTAEELLNVAVECLRTGRVASSDHAPRDSTVDI